MPKLIPKNGETHGHERTHDEADDDLPPKERHHALGELAHEENDVTPQIPFNKRKLLVKVAGEVAVGQEKEEEIDGNDSHGGGPREDAHEPGANATGGRNRFLCPTFNILEKRCLVAVQFLLAQVGHKKILHLGEALCQPCSDTIDKGGKVARELNALFKQYRHKERNRESA